MSPALSLVIPVYNSERYIEQCLDSIAKQPFEDYEIVIVDDGSTDASLMVCQRYCEKHPDLNIRIFSQENCGCYATRINGIAHSQGEYIWSIDSDDMVSPDSLQIISGVISETHADLVFFECCYDPSFSHFRNKPPFEKSSSFVGEGIRGVYEAYCRGSMYPFVTKVIKRSLLSSIDFITDFEGLNNAEDQLLDVQVLDYVDCAYYIRRPLYYYRDNGVSITHRYVPGMYLDQMRVEETESRFISDWAKRIESEELLNEYRISFLIDVFCSLKKTIDRKTAAQQIGEIRSSAVYRDSLSQVPSLRADQRAFYHLVEENKLTGAFLILEMSSCAGRLRRLFTNRMRVE